MLVSVSLRCQAALGCCRHVAARGDVPPSGSRERPDQTRTMRRSTSTGPRCHSLRGAETSPHGAHGDEVFLRSAAPRSPFGGPTRHLGASALRPPHTCKAAALATREASLRAASATSRCHYGIPYKEEPLGSASRLRRQRGLRPGCSARTRRASRNPRSLPCS